MGHLYHLMAKHGKLYKGLKQTAVAQKVTLSEGTIRDYYRKIIIIRDNLGVSNL